MQLEDLKTDEINSFLSWMDEISLLLKKAELQHARELNGERYFTNTELCSVLHISKRALQEYRDTGKIPYIKLYGKILYRESDIHKLLQDNYLKGF